MTPVIEVHDPIADVSPSDAVAGLYHPRRGCRHRYLFKEPLLGYINKIDGRGTLLKVYVSKVILIVFSVLLAMSDTHTRETDGSRSGL